MKYYWKRHTWPQLKALNTKRPNLTYILGRKALFTADCSSGACAPCMGNPLSAPSSTNTCAGTLAGCLAELWSTETRHGETLSQPSLAGGQRRSPAGWKCSVPQGASWVKPATKWRHQGYRRPLKDKGRWCLSNMSAIISCLSMADVLCVGSEKKEDSKEHLGQGGFC